MTKKERALNQRTSGILKDMEKKGKQTREEFEERILANLQKEYFKELMEDMEKYPSIQKELIESKVNAIKVVYKDNQTIQEYSYRRAINTLPKRFSRIFHQIWIEWQE